MDEVDDPGTPPGAPTTTPPPPPRVLTSRPSAPKPAAAPPRPEPAPVTDGPVAPGGRWPAPAPLPPEEEPGRSWRKIAVPVAAVVLVLGIVAALTMGGGGDSGGSEPAASKGGGKVDLSDIDDPASTTTRPPTTTTTTDATATTVATSDGRVLVESESGITWSMAAAPEVRDIASSGSAGPTGRGWTAVEGGTTERVDLLDLDADGGPFDPDQAMQAFAEELGSTLSAIEDSHIAEAPGRTASFSGTVGGKAVVGYVVAARVGGQGMVIAMYRDGDDLDDLYLDWLTLPSSVKLP